MKNKPAVFNSAAALCVAVVTLVLTASATRAGGLGFGMSGPRVIDAPSRVSPGRGGDNAQPIVTPASRTTADSAVTAKRHGADDPAGHDANDDRGRHRGRGRGR